MRNSLASALVAFYLFLCLVLGGASAAGLWANALLQLLAIPFILAAIVVRPAAPLGRAGRRLAWLAALAGAIVLVQLVPLPPSVWTALPGRDHVAEGFELLGLPLPWLPISLAPRATLAAALWLLPALAVGLGVLRLGARPSWICWAVVLATALSVVVGALQIAGGADSRWYFYFITNYGVMVGFFANANHMATLLVATVPLLGALAMAGRGKGRSSRSAGLFVILAGLFGLVLVGVAINGSLAGIGLTLPAVGATLLLMRRERGVPPWAIGAVALLVLASVGAIFSGKFGNNLLNAEAQAGVSSRSTAVATTLQAAKDHLPFGSGVGTFQPIYRLYEDPEQVTNTYMNHAHSDWAEILLETGLPGAAVLLLFLAWWGWRTLAIWRAREADWFGRAATIVTGIVLAHSLVDYPLRTAAISAAFAAACAIMVGRARGRGGKSWPAQRPARHLSAD